MSGALDTLFRLPYGPGLPNYGLPSGCPCACCKEAANRFFHERVDARLACSCADHPEATHCDCRYCAEVLAAMVHAS